MKYKMYNELQDQPKSIVNTLKHEKSHMKEISEKFKDFDKIYLVGCGSSLSTCYSVRDALSMLYDTNIEVFTGYEFFYHKKISNKNAGVIFTSQSGETVDTIAALRKSQKIGIENVVITNEKNSTMAKECDDVILTRCGRESAIVATKTYVTQLFSLYYILFGMKENKKIIKELEALPKILRKIIDESEEKNKILAKKYKDKEIFYCIGSGPNYGLAYKLAMTMLMEGAHKHACPLYSGEFKHSLVERIENGIPVIILNADFPGDKLTIQALEFCKKVGADVLLYDMKDYCDIDKLLSPFVLVCPLEWFVYYLAHYNGKDPGSTRHIDKIRNNDDL